MSDMEPGSDDDEDEEDELLLLLLLLLLTGLLLLLVCGEVDGLLIGVVTALFSEPLLPLS